MENPVKVRDLTEKELFLIREVLCKEIRSKVLGPKKGANLADICETVLLRSCLHAPAGSTFRLVTVPPPAPEKLGDP